MTMENQANKQPLADVTRIILRWSIRETMGVVMIALLLFLSAGCWDWSMGWVLVAITALWVIATGLVVIPRYPELLAERLGPRKGAKTWDTAIMGIVGLGAITRLYIVTDNARTSIGSAPHSKPHKTCAPVHIPSQPTWWGGVAWNTEKVCVALLRRRANCCIV